MAHLIRTFTALALIMMTAPGALAQSDQERRDQLTQLYMVTVSQDLCGFTVTEKQSEAITKTSDDLEDKLALSEEEADKIYTQIEEQMKKQKESGLCNPDGDWAKSFKKSVEAMVK